MLTESTDDEQIIERVAALDIGKAEVVCCVRLPSPVAGKRRLQEVTTHSTMTGSLTELANRLVELGVERVVMEATSDYWRPPFYLFEAHGLEPWLVNAKDVRHLPGRPKTDVLDAVWLCKVAERQMLRPSFVPPRPIRRLRDLTRYRIDLVGARTAEKNRVEKLLEDACIKLSVVASDIFGVSGREMMAALIGGERDPKVLAQMARSRMRAKIPQLEEAFTEIGVDMSRFPTPGHLASWAKFAPGVSSSAGKDKGNGFTGHGNRYLAKALGDAAAAVGKTNTFLGERVREALVPSACSAGRATSSPDRSCSSQGCRCCPRSNTTRTTRWSRSTCSSWGRVSA